MRLQQAEEEKEAALNEHRLIRKFFNDVRHLSDARQLEIVELRQQLQAKEKQRLEEIAEWKDKYEMDIDAMETSFKN